MEQPAVVDRHEVGPRQGAPRLTDLEGGADHSPDHLIADEDEELLSVFSEGIDSAHIAEISRFFEGRLGAVHHREDAFDARAAVGDDERLVELEAVLADGHVGAMSPGDGVLAHRVCVGADVGASADGHLLITGERGQQERLVIGSKDEADIGAFTQHWVTDDKGDAITGQVAVFFGEASLRDEQLLFVALGELVDTRALFQRAGDGGEEAVEALGELDEIT